jgi:hypothetical protein
MNRTGPVIGLGVWYAVGQDPDATRLQVMPLTIEKNREHSVEYVDLLIALGVQVQSSGESRVFAELAHPPGAPGGLSSDHDAGFAEPLAVHASLIRPDDHGVSKIAVSDKIAPPELRDVCGCSWSRNAGRRTVGF